MSRTTLLVCFTTYLFVGALPAPAQNWKSFAGRVGRAAGGFAQQSGQRGRPSNYASPRQYNSGRGGHSSWQGRGFAVPSYPRVSSPPRVAIPFNGNRLPYFSAPQSAGRPQPSPGRTNPNGIPHVVGRVIEQHIGNRTQPAPSASGNWGNKIRDVVKQGLPVPGPSDLGKHLQIDTLGGSAARPGVKGGNVHQQIVRRLKDHLREQLPHNGQPIPGRAGSVVRPGNGRIDHRKQPWWSTLVHVWGMQRYHGYCWNRPRPPVDVYLPPTFVCPAPVPTCPAPPVAVCPPPAIVLPPTEEEIIAPDPEIAEHPGDAPSADVEQNGPIDLQVEYIELVESRGQESDEGPLYRIWIRNEGEPIVRPFDVAVVAMRNDRPDDDSPFVTSRVAKLDANSRASIEIRLPAEVLQMGIDVEGNSTPFKNLAVIVDALGELDEEDESNNALAYARTAIPDVNEIVAQN